jgi:rubrerythrin
MQKAFRDFAQEELGHKAKLQSAKGRGRLLPSRGEVLDLKLADYLVVGDVVEGMDYQQALILAMKKEKAAFRLYTDLADRVGDDDVRAMLLTLAQEEAKHKLRFEVEYDEVILTDN